MGLQVGLFHVDKDGRKYGEFVGVPSSWTHLRGKRPMWLFFFFFDIMLKFLDFFGPISRQYFLFFLKMACIKQEKIT